MAGQRWDLDVREPIDFGDSARSEHIRKAAIGAGQQWPSQWIDYFVYPRGLYQGKILVFVIGRPSWGQWLLWWAEKSGLPVIDASDMAIPIHQNNDYSYHPDGEQSVWQGEEAPRNYALQGGGQNYRRVEDATYRLAPGVVGFDYRRWWSAGQAGRPGETQPSVVCGAKRHAAAAPPAGIEASRRAGFARQAFMKIFVTGTSGLIASEVFEHFDRQGCEIFGVDKNMRRDFFGAPGDTLWNLEPLRNPTKRFAHFNIDIHDR